MTDLWNDTLQKLYSNLHPKLQNTWPLSLFAYLLWLYDQGQIMESSSYTIALFFKNPLQFDNKYIQYKPSTFIFNQDFRAYWFVFLPLNMVSKVDRYSAITPIYIFIFWLNSKFTIIKVKYTIYG